MITSRGLAALILTILFHTALSAEYLYKDEVIHNPLFNKTVEKLGSELYEKTGVSLRLVMLKKLPEGLDINSYELELLKDFNEPTILLTFSELDSKVDILASESSLYKYFNKKQVLSPVASPVQAFLMSIVYARSIEELKSMLNNTEGTILPVLSVKSKPNELIGKYSAAMYNGYLDIAHQVATSKGVVLENDAGNTNKNGLFIIKFIFYTIIIIAIYMYIKRRLFIRRQKNELQ
ncbi:MAG: 3-dehydroquinate dehydratase [Sulfurimonas sp.]|nr:3-dehydroquinate dehydratase [Sulfurimonas sp.]